MPYHDAPNFAVCAPGLERILEAELRALGAPGIAPEPGGVGFGGGDDWVARANLHLRTASRILVRVVSFRAEAFHELERAADRVKWDRWVDADRGAQFRVTCHKSRLYHSDAVAQRLMRSVARKVGTSTEGAPLESQADDDASDAGDPLADPFLAPQRFVARFVRDVCTISADASGVLLHRRGYRQALARAPLRETLAAAMLLGSGWTPDRPLLDPMCGSGTVAIEGALIGRGIAPGLARRFAAEAWPGARASTWERLRDEAVAAILPRTPAPVFAADRDAGAVEATRTNAARAGVLDDLSIEQRPLSAMPPLPPGGWLVTNPPYGVRVGDRSPLRDLYARLGDLVSTRLDGWSLALLSADPSLERQLRLPLAERWRSTNGGIPVRLMTFAGRAEERAAIDASSRHDGALRGGDGSVER